MRSEAAFVKHSCKHAVAMAALEWQMTVMTNVPNKPDENSAKNHDCVKKNDSAKKNDKAERLAAALRENLRRRKAQSRATKADSND